MEVEEEWGGGGTRRKEGLKESARQAASRDPVVDVFATHSASSTPHSPRLHSKPRTPIVFTSLGAALAIHPPSLHTSFSSSASHSTSGVGIPSAPRCAKKSAVGNSTMSERISVTCAPDAKRGGPGIRHGSCVCSQSALTTSFNSPLSALPRFISAHLVVVVDANEAETRAAHARHRQEEPEPGDTERERDLRSG